MKLRLLLLLVMFTGAMSIQAQNYTWHDKYTITYTGCTNPATLKETDQGVLNLSNIPTSLDITVPGSPYFGSSKPLGKTYKIKVFKKEGSNLTLVGTITNDLNLAWPTDFNALLPLMTDGTYELHMSVVINWQYDTPYTIGYKCYKNNTVIKTVSDLEVTDGFEVDLGPVNCFNFVKCFTASVSVVKPWSQNYTDVTVNTAGGSGNYSYYFAAEINKFNPGSSTCVIGPFGTPVPFTTLAPNKIRFACSRCNTIVYIQVIDNVTGCVRNMVANVNRCLTTIDPEPGPSGPKEEGKTRPVVTEEASRLSMKMIGNRQLLVDKGEYNGQVNLRIVDFQGRLIMQKDLIGSGTHRVDVSTLQAGNVYIAVLQQNGTLIKREKILIQ